MSGSKTVAKLLIGICMITSYFSGWTHTVAVNTQAFALLTLALTFLAVIIGGVAYTEGEDSLGTLIVGGIITIANAGSILYCLNTAQPFLLQWIAFEIGAIIFLFY